MVMSTGGFASTHVLSEIQPRIAGMILRGLPTNRQEETFSYLSHELQQQLREALQYPAESAGAIMEPQAWTLMEDLTVEQAVSSVRAAPRSSLFYLYVTNRNRQLVGVLNTRELLLASPHSQIADLVHRNVISVPVMMDREKVADLMRERGFLALPVVSDEGRLLGLVTHEQVLDAVEEEAFEDLQRTVGAGADETADSPVRLVVMRRLPWLMVNLATTFIASAIVASFESVIAKVSALAVLLPIVAGQAGNSGAQSLAVLLRSLALEELAPGGTARVLRKELLAGVVNGLVIAIFTAGGVYFWTGSIALPLVIGGSMWLSLILAPLMGAAIPVLLQRGGLDPAQSSTIFLTTFTEIIGFGLFLGLAALFIQYLI